MTYQPDQLVWTDIETTGLAVKDEVVLEVGFAITNLDLEIIDERHWLVWDPEYYGRVVETMIPFVAEMHTKNGLLDDARKHGLDPRFVAYEMVEMVQEWGINSDDPLCGSSVGFDRDHLKQLAPSAMAAFSYRNGDVSSFKEMVRRYKPAAYNRMQIEIIPRKEHRTQPDIIDTLEEFRFYATVLGLR